MYYNREFLSQLDKTKHKVIYARITALTFQEQPIETIEGRVTQGSINVDGNSAVRRTCSLTMVAKNFDYQNYYWGLNTKFKLEVGVENTINSYYPDTIWFNQGIYVFTSFNTSRSTNNFTISLQGKDKMCLLNGEVGGSLESSIDFGQIEEEDADGNWAITSLPIYQIIRNAVHTYAGEPYHNIIINDLDDYGLELLEYRYDTPLYLYRSVDSTIYDNILLNGKKECSLVREGQVEYITLEELLPNELDMLVNTLTGTTDPVPVTIDGGQYYVTKISYGETAGYRLTDLTYAGDLIANVGESITSILDKIKNMLSEFEYFYDLDGQFVFQRKQSFVNTLWSPIVDSEDELERYYSDKYVESLATASAWAYVFNEGELITAFNNNPNLNNMRNDFSIWGVRKGTSGADIPVHLRYAIDIKPKAYVAFNGKIYTTLSENEYYDLGMTVQGEIVPNQEWREIIYQMGLDYYQHNTEDDFELNLAKNNSPLYPLGITGYERYYIDLQGFWRQLYYPTLWQEIEEIQKELDKEVNKKLEEKLADLKILSEQFYPEGHTHAFWHKNVYEYPEALNFWFDFLDVEGELSQFNVKNVGARSKAINETTVKSIYFRETPDVIFKEYGEQIEPMSGYKYIQVQDIDTMFTISSQGKSAKDRLDELIYQHGYCIENATITTVPIYYLQPNTRIHVCDVETNLSGDYIVSKLTIPLTYNGTMSITATKAAESII